MLTCMVEPCRGSVDDKVKLLKILEASLFGSHRKETNLRRSCV